MFVKAEEDEVEDEGVVEDEEIAEDEPISEDDEVCTIIYFFSFKLVEFSLKSSLKIIQKTVFSKCL